MLLNHAAESLKKCLLLPGRAPGPRFGADDSKQLHRGVPSTSSNEWSKRMSADRYTLKTGDLCADQPEEEAYSVLIDDIHNLANSELMQLFNDMLNGADALLAGLTLESEDDECSKNTTDEKRTQQINAIRTLCNERNVINTNFFIAVNDQLKPAIEPGSEDEEELSLVDHEEMEEMVAITTMHANALNLFGEAVSHMEARIEYLEITSAPIFDKQALNPNRICEAFQTALKQLEISTEHKLILFKLFDEQVNLQLGDMYEAINQLFIDAGVMPEIILKTLEHEEEEERTFTSRTATYYDPQENKSTNFIPRSHDEMNSIVSQFMKGDISVMGDELELPASFYKDPSEQNIDGKEFYARKDVVRSLSRLQKKLRELGENASLLSAEEIKRSLMEEIGISNGGVVNKEVTILDERSIDFVGMMFDAITVDESISDVVTNLILQLQIPVIKVAMNDEQLFENDNHPARKVLNLVPKAGRGVTEKEDRIYNELETIIDNILSEYDVDIVAFEKAGEELEELIQREEKLSSQQEKEEQRAIIKKHARSVVLTEMRRLSSSKLLPKDVQPLVLKHWSTLMLNRYVSHGKESNEWLQSIMLLKLLIKSLQPIRHRSQWEMLNSNHNALTEAVNDELYETRQDRKSIDDQVSNLKNTFIRMLDEYGYVIAQEEAEEIEEEEMEISNEEVSIIEEEARTALEKIRKLPGIAKPGVWFEIFNGEDHPVRRLKMSVILTEAARIIFVDRKGIKVIEKDAGEFADELSTNKSRVLADHSTFDSALGRVITALAA